MYKLIEALKIKISIFNFVFANNTILLFFFFFFFLMIGLYFLIPAFNVHIFKPTEELATAEVEANPETETLATEMKTKKCAI